MCSHSHGGCGYYPALEVLLFVAVIAVVVAAAAAAAASGAGAGFGLLVASC